MDKQFVQGIRYVDELVCRDDTTQRLYATQDANFNLTAIADTSGSVVERYLFDPYGNRTIMNTSWNVLSASAYDWGIGFQGLMLDEESELVYVRNRYLQPGLGRWMEEDHLKLETDQSPPSFPRLSGPPVLPGIGRDGMNLYEYERSSPVKFLDPQGMFCSIATQCHHVGGFLPTCQQSLESRHE